MLVLEPVLDRARGIGRQKRSDCAGTGQRRLKILDIAPELGLTDITQLADADRHGLTAGIARARVRLEVLEKFPLVAGCDAEPPVTAARPALAPSDARRNVIGEIGLRQLAVIDDVEPALDLPFDDV